MNCPILSILLIWSNMIDITFINNFEGELEYFTNRKAIKLYRPDAEDVITLSEDKLGCAFSPQMKQFYSRYNGGRIFEVRIQGIPSIGFSHISKDYDIVETNMFLRKLKGWEPYWLDIGMDGFGNYYVADVNQRQLNGEYPIIFMDHEQIGNRDFSSLYAESFSEFILKAVNEMKHIYSPIGDLLE